MDHVLQWCMYVKETCDSPEIHNKSIDTFMNIIQSIVQWILYVSKWNKVRLSKLTKILCPIKNSACSLLWRLSVPLSMIWILFSDSSTMLELILLSVDEKHEIPISEESPTECRATTCWTYCACWRLVSIDDNKHWDNHAWLRDPELWNGT